MPPRRGVARYAGWTVGPWIWFKRLFRFVGITATGVAATAAIVALIVVSLSRLVTGATHGTPEPLPKLLSVTAAQPSTIYAGNDEVLATLSGSQYRVPVPLSQISPTLIHAVIDTEDANFWSEGPFEIRSFLRALKADTSAGTFAQGGSTITEQLAKKEYLSSQKTIKRKIRQIILGIRLAKKYSKKKILDTYLNIVYFGNGAYGIQAAAETYFDEPASKLTLPQAALLAGMISDPNGYDPIAAPDAARLRRSEVLSRMKYYGTITSKEEFNANAAPIPTHATAPPTTPPIDGYYVEQVENQLLSPGSPLGKTYAQRYRELFEGGLAIYTNLHPALEAAAENSVHEDIPATPQGFTAALSVMNPTNGEVWADVGGPGTNVSKFDLDAQGMDQPGSGFKIFTLLSALEAGDSPYSTIDASSPCQISFPGNNGYVTHPLHNDPGDPNGKVSLVTATADSINCAYMRLANTVGLPAVVAMAKRLGITTPLNDTNPSLVIGTELVHPLQMTAAYAAVADYGIYHTPAFINHITNSAGQTIYTENTAGVRVLPAQIAEEAIIDLQGVVNFGTGTAAQIPGREVAGKTGTTTNSVAAWFNGFTPQFASSVWMGSPTKSTPIYIDGAEVYGANYPATIWRDVAEAALNGAPAIPFVPPNKAQIPPAQYIIAPGDLHPHLYPTTTTTVPHRAPAPPSKPSPPPPKSPPTGAPGGGGGHHGGPVHG